MAQDESEVNLRKLARGQECVVRSRYCNGDPETVVLAHIRRGGVGGMGMKPPDLCGVFACSACHDALDRRNGSLTDTEILEALCRQLAWVAGHDIEEPW